MDLVRIRGPVGSVLAACLVWSCCGGDDDCKSVTDFALPITLANVSQTVRLDFARSRGEPPAFSCTFDSEAGGFPWSCLPRPRELPQNNPVSVSVQYEFEPSRWVVSAAGPGGSSEFELEARANEESEASPVGCANDCSFANAAVPAAELAQVGVQFPAPAEPPPTFGAACASHQECQGGLFCGLLGAATAHCTRSCSLEIPCPLGSTCEPNEICSTP
jgi:hypothetical protein